MKERYKGLIAIICLIIAIGVIVYGNRLADKDLPSIPTPEDQTFTITEEQPKVCNVINVRYDVEQGGFIFSTEDHELGAISFDNLLITLLQEKMKAE